MFTISPIDGSGIAQILEDKGYKSFISTLPGHESTYADLAHVSGEDWLSFVQEEVTKLIRNEEAEEILLLGFSLGGLLVLLAAYELLVSGEFTSEQWRRVRLMAINSPIKINGVPDSVFDLIARLPRNILKKIPIPNVPRPGEQNREYLKKAMFSKWLPISTTVEMENL